jgi:hypothetical protein
MSVTLGQAARNARSGNTDAEMSSGDANAAAASSSAPRAEGTAARSASGNAVPNMNSVVEGLEVNGEIPQARFGHTITIVSKAKVVLFGGATGDTGKYSMTGETFMYNILNKAW